MPLCICSWKRSSVKNSIMVDSASAHLMQVHRVLFAYEHTESYASEACKHSFSKQYQSLRCFMVYIHTLICSTVFMLWTLMQQFFSSCHGEGSVVQLSTVHKNRYSSRSIGQNLIKHAQSHCLMSKQMDGLWTQKGTLLIFLISVSNMSKMEQ